MHHHRPIDRSVLNQWFGRLFRRYCRQYLQLVGVQHYVCLLIWGSLLRLGVSCSIVLLIVLVVVRLSLQSSMSCLRSLWFVWRGPVPLCAGLPCHVFFLWQYVVSLLSSQELLPSDVSICLALTSLCSSDDLLVINENILVALADAYSTAWKYHRRRVLDSFCSSQHSSLRSCFTLFLLFLLWQVFKLAPWPCL